MNTTVAVVIGAAVGYFVGVIIGIGVYVNGVESGWWQQSASGSWNTPNVVSSAIVLGGILAGGLVGYLLVSR